MNDLTTGVLYPILPLRDIVVFPHMIVPLFVGRERSVRALEEVMKGDKKILLVTQKEAGKDDPEADDIYTVGTIGTALQLLKLPDGTVKVLVEGTCRARVLRHTQTDPFFQADVEEIEDTGEKTEEVEALTRTVMTSTGSPSLACPYRRAFST